MIESPMITFPLLILFLPLISFIILIFFGKKLPRQGDWVAVGSIVTTFILAVYLFVQMLTNYDANFSHGASLSWIDMGAFKIDLGILVDNLTIVMLLIVTLVSSCTHIFSLEYMKGDVRYNRYYAYLGLFTFSMNGIVLADNLISMYMSWELVGVSSYLLIGHWFEKDSAANASKKAFLTNRVGDIGFFIGIMLLYSAVGAFTFAPIFDSISGGEAIAGMTLTLAGLGIFMGAVGKSSQFPLHIWLPDAMEGPTPVSALMHAATMVAAGVYMCVRLFPIFTADALTVIAYIGAITAILAALTAITQNDIKKVLAYSTVSQLGFMVLAVGTGVYTAAFFHLLTHAMFKANLFYCSGSVIHSMHHALHEAHDHDTDPQDMTGPIVLLGALSFFIFYTLPSNFNPIKDKGWFKDLIVPRNSAVPGSLTANEIAEYAHHAHYLAMGLSLFVAAAGILLAVFMYQRQSISAEKLATKFGFLYHWSYNKFYFDENYNRYLYQPFLRLANSISWLDWEFYDKYFINGFGKLTKLFSKISGKFDYDGIDQGLVDGFGRVSAVSGNFLRNIQTGRLQNYLLFVVAGILVIIIAQAF